MSISTITLSTYSRRHKRYGQLSSREEEEEHKIDLRGSANPAYVHGLPSLRSPKPIRSSTITSSFRMRKPFYNRSFRRSGGQEQTTALLSSIQITISTAQELKHSQVGILYKKSTIFLHLRISNTWKIHHFSS